MFIVNSNVSEITNQNERILLMLKYLARFREELTFKPDRRAWQMTSATVWNLPLCNLDVFKRTSEGL